MAEAVAGLLTSAFVKIAKDKLGSAIAQQANLLWNFDGDLEDMMEKLETISAALEDAEGRSVKEKLVQLWLKQLKRAALDISDILEYYQDTSDQATTANMPWFLSCLPIGCTRIVVANRMKTARENLSKINKEFQNFKFRQGTTTTIEQCYDERETTSDLPEDPIIGRDGEKQKIIDLLLSADTNNDEIVIVPIYGLGGMGKSTLAQQVFNDDRFKKYDHRVWVYVSEYFNLLQIGRSIISQLPANGGQQNSSTQQVINSCIRSLLHGKKVLVVLDDLWEDKLTELDKLRMLLHVKDSMMRVIITTRKEGIARKISTGEPYKLQPLKDDICWEIIKRSSKFDLKSNKERLEEIGLDIARKCGGVALAAQAIGFMLRFKHDEFGWTKLNNSDIWNEPCEDNDVLPSLKLSYERMPPELRICFSYCAIFPKGHDIVEDDLVHQWIALGFIERSKGIDCMKMLLEMSFLQVSKLPSTSQEHVVRYTMHDLVHDLARLTMADELIVFDVAAKRNMRVHKHCQYSLLRKYDGTTKLSNILPTKLRVLCFSDCGKLDIPSDAFSFAKCLRTLDFSETSGIFLPDSIGQLKQLRCLIAPRMQNKSLPEFITKLAKLHYLNINESCEISTLPESICKLGCLEYLGLSGCSRMSKLPESLCGLTNLKKLGLSLCNVNAVDFIGTLTNLEDLNLSHNPLACLPESICNLKRLQTLDLSWCGKLESLPDSIGALGLKSLLLDHCSAELMDHASSLVHYSRTLPVFKVLADDVSGCRKLHLLEGAHHINELKILSLENARCLEEACKAKLADKHNLSELTLKWTVGVNRHLNDIDLLDQLVPPRGLEHLRLEGYSCTGFPGWVMAISGHLTNLISIVLWNMPNCSNLPALGQLPHLEKLTLLSLPSIKKISWEFCGGKGAFRRLSSLKISSMEGLEEWSTTYYAQDGVEEFMFPVLDSLIIEQCPRLRLKPCPPTFREFRIAVSDQVLSSFEEVRRISHHTSSSRATKLELSEMPCQSMEVFHHFSALQELEISFCHKLTSLPESLRHLTSLRSLTLQCCKGISALPEWLGDLSCLKTFEINDCRSIKSLPSCIHQLKELEKLKIRCNRKLKEWCESEENKVKLAHINVIEFQRCDYWLPA